MLNFRDWMQDIDLFADGAVFSFFSHVTPFLSVWSSIAHAQIVAVEEYIDHLLPVDPDRYFHTLVSDAVTAATGDTVLVGHSLGGGVAKIVAAIHKLQAVSISGPGIRQIIPRLGPKVHHLNSVNLISDDDIVSRIGKQEGITSRFECPVGYSMPHRCHLPIFAISSLIKRCGHVHPTRLVDLNLSW